MGIDLEKDIEGSDNDSSQQGLTRAEFLSQILIRAAGAGMILGSPLIVDRFLVPPAYAAYTGPKATRVGVDTTAYTTA